MEVPRGAIPQECAPQAAASAQVKDLQPPLTSGEVTGNLVDFLPIQPWAPLPDLEVEMDTAAVEYLKRTSPSQSSSSSGSQVVTWGLWGDSVNEAKLRLPDQEDAHFLMVLNKWVGRAARRPLNWTSLHISFGLTSAWCGHSELPSYALWLVCGVEE